MALPSGDGFAECLEYASASVIVDVVVVDVEDEQLFAVVRVAHRDGVGATGYDDLAGDLDGARENLLVDEDDHAAGGGVGAGRDPSLVGVVKVGECNVQGSGVAVGRIRCGRARSPRRMSSKRVCSMW